MAVLKRVLAGAALAGLASAAPLVKKGDFQFVATVPYGDTIFSVGDIDYLASTSSPVLSAASTHSLTTGSIVPFTVITTGDCYVSADFVSSTVESFAEWDDVYSAGFLEGVYISSNCTGATIDPAVFTWAESANVTSLFLSSDFASVNPGKTSYTVSSIYQPTPIECGPYAVAISEGGAASFSLVYRLYEDFQRTFIMGVYPAQDSIGSFKGLPQYLTKFQDEMIPVPSRIYSWSDSRPLAGLRVAIKDLYDLNGVQTSGGSRSWATITPIANITAPAIQRVIDLGGHIVAKFKTAQFASGANPWDFIDTQPPFNPRGDGYLTCDCSSAGGGCSMAAYDWLDHSIGSDTSWSMRRPASVSGTYGNRPSQGMITLDHVLPLGATQDTAGVFARTPKAWAHFAKNWYSPTLHQDSSITGLTEPLIINDTYKWPAKVYYPKDLFEPARNPAAAAIVQEFVANLTALGIQRVDINITDMVLKAPIASVSNVATWKAASSLLITNTAYWVIGKPLVTAWAAMFGGRYPPLDPNHTSWFHFNESTISDDKVAAAIAVKQAYSDWINYDFLGADDETCSGALWVYDIGTGGLPSYRYQQLITTAYPQATNMSYTPPTAKFTGSSVCSFAGCPDYTVPIGQVPYYSNVTFTTEMVPVTINVVARRGCDFMLFNLFEEMENRGMLATIKTGRTAF
ncbi:amidase family protein [Calocera cornea HHB12733]|uniref:Amidase family protein n=1 Tax=Calocera cornea HHB12733 TaxID=1353952 RepID=A0A165KBC0_9BASI|nr:amidase family protein [Calocera cornea HHB12733]